MNIHQLQANYQLEQDRVLLRLNTQTGEEYRLWLTRRMAKGAFPHMVQQSQRMAAQSGEAVGHDGHHAANKAADLATFRQQESLAKADFQTPYAEGVPQTGPTPLLVTHIHVTPVDDNTLRIGFEEKLPNADSKRQCEVTLSLTTIHALLHLLETVFKAADWGLGAEPAPGAAPEPDAELDVFAAVDRPVYLN